MTITFEELATTIKGKDRLSCLEEIMKFYPEFSGIHPACEALPPLTESEWEALSSDIRDMGLACDLLRDEDGLLVDGRHRLLACWEHNKEIRVQTIYGDAWDYVYSHNFAQRSTTAGQRAIFAERWREAEEAKAKERQRVRKGNQNGADNPGNITGVVGDTRDKLGERVGVSGKSVDKARAIIEDRPDLAQQVSDGEITLEAAHRELVQSTLEDFVTATLEARSILADAHTRIRAAIADGTLSAEDAYKITSFADDNCFSPTDVSRECWEHIDRNAEGMRPHAELDSEVAEMLKTDEMSHSS